LDRTYYEINGKTNYDEQYAIKEYAYSRVSYCSATNIFNWNCIYCQNLIPKPGQITLFYNKTGSNRGFLGYDKYTNTIKIVFQGTNPRNIKEWIDDLDFFKIKYQQPLCPDC